MLKNNKWNVLNTVLIVTVIIIIISYWIMKSSLFVSDTVKNNKLSSNSIIDVNNNRIENNQIKWDLFVSNEKNKVNIDTVSLDEWKTLEVNIPGNNIMNSKIKLDFNTWSVNRYVWLELSKTKNNKLLINKNIDTRWGFIIKDSSAWTETAQETNYNQQIYYLQNSKLSELSNYINSEIIKIWEPGSYLLFDFWYSSLFNNFNYQLTNENKTSFPNIIQLTFDNGVQYSYLVNDTKEVQKLFFPDIETKYIRLDILSTSDWRVDVNNTNVINNIDRNINSDEITVTDDEINKTLNITFPNLSLINWVKFVNLYSWYNWKISTNSFKSLLGTETNFIYHYNNISLDTIYFELCSDINVCLEKVSKPIN
jgi:hypothetical protein